MPLIKEMRTESSGSASSWASASTLTSSLQSRSGARHGEVLVTLLPDDIKGNPAIVAEHTLPTTRRADGILGVHRGLNRGTVAEHVLRLLPFAGVGVCSVAINGLAAGPGSPAIAFDLFAMFLGGLFLVILHVLRV